MAKTSMGLGVNPSNENNVGFPMFDNEFKQAIRIEIHYNNPKLISGMKDSSGVRLHYTSTPRLHEAAFLQLGDPLLGLYGEKITGGLTKHEFTCGGSCSSLFLDEPVTVIFEALHMHKTGTRMVSEVIRGDEVVHTAKVEVFDFDQQGKFCPVPVGYHHLFICLSSRDTLISWHRRIPTPSRLLSVTSG